MKIKNPLAAKDWTLGRFLLLLWCFFATAFVLYAGWGVVQNAFFVRSNQFFQAGAQQGIIRGQDESVKKIMRIAQNCNIVTLYAGEAENRVEMGLVDVNCTPEQIQAAVDAAANAAAAAATAGLEAAEAPIVDEVIMDEEVVE